MIYSKTESIKYFRKNYYFKFTHSFSHVSPKMLKTVKVGCWNVSGVKLANIMPNHRELIN